MSEICLVQAAVEDSIHSTRDLDQEVEGLGDLMEDRDAAFLVEVLETILEEDMDSIILQKELVFLKPNQLKTVWALNVNKEMFSVIQEEQEVLGITI